MKKEIPILFSTPMVRAILDGRKTMTRRIIKPQPNPDGDAPSFMPVAPCLDWESIYKDEWKPWHWETAEGESISKHCPYGQPGDILWVRETWCKGYTVDDNEEASPLRYFYRADDDWKKIDWHDSKNDTTKPAPRWKPSIHMPYEACRLWLRIKNVHIERLQQISSEDIYAEGVMSQQAIEQGTNPFTAFSELWCKINGEESWQSNPFVWVINFRVLKPSSL